MFGLIGGMLGAGASVLGSQEQMRNVANDFERQIRMADAQRNQAANLRALVDARPVVVNCDSCGAPKRGACDYCGRP